jgi:RHS repeat-associated protein
MIPTSRGRSGRMRLGVFGRVAAAAVAGLAGVLAWTAIAGGTQPYEAYEATVAADGPVAQFRFSDSVGATTIADSAGSYTATNNGSVLGGEGPFGGSKSGLFGGEAYASLPSNPLAGASAFTAEVWVDWTGGESYEQPIFGFGSGATNYIDLTPADGSKHLLLLEIRTGASTDVQVTAPRLTAKRWEYVAVTETTSGTLTLYLNGEQVGQTTGASLFPSSIGSAGNDYLGKSQVSGAPLFNGSMSNLAFYNKALSAERIKAHYDAGEYPVNTVAPAIAGTAKDGSALTASNGTWTGLTPITYAYQWILCNAAGEACASIPSATETKYVLGHGDVGDTLRVAVTGANNEGSSTMSSAQTSVVAPLAPLDSVLPAISGEAKQGQLLSVSDGTWAGTPPLSYTYQWETCNSAAGKCKKIPGATASSYRVLGSQIGDTLRAIVTAENAAGSDNATSEITAVITTGRPVDIALPAISGKAEDGQVLSASSGSWAGTEPIFYAYQWQLCNSSGETCANITGATSSSFTLASDDVGDTLRIALTAENSVGSVSVNSSVSAIVTGPPSDVAAPVIIGTAQDGQTLSASSGTWSGYPRPSYTYQWQRCNSSGGSCLSLTGATGSTYALAHSDVGATLRVAVLATSSAGSGSATSEATGVVTPLAPSNTVAPAIIGTAEDGETLAASTGSWNGTPPITYGYQWETCDSLGGGCLDVSGATSSSFTLEPSDVGMTVRVLVTATNSASSVPSTSEATATIMAGVNGPLSYSGQFGSAGSGDGQFNHPADVAVDDNGDMFVLDRGNDRVQEFNETGEYVRQFGSEGSGSGELRNPDGLAVNSEDDVWVLDTGNRRIEEFNEDGELMRTAGSGMIESAEGIAVDRKGEVWVSATYEGHLVVFNSDGEYSKTVGSEGSGPGQFDEPEGLAVDANGHVWVAEWDNNRVQELGETGEYLGQFGSAGAGVGEISRPYGIAADNGHVFVGEAGNDRLQEFDEDGGFISDLGTSGSEPGQVSLNIPIGLTANATEDVWIADSGNNRVEEWAPGASTASQAPESTTPPTITGTAHVGQTLSTSAGTWRGVPQPVLTFQWQGCDASGGDCANISGATSSTLVVGRGDVGSTLRATVTATNTSGSVSSTSEATAVVVPPPENTSPPVISGTAQDGHTLTASTGTWEGIAPISYAYQWQLCEEITDACREIPGATESTYTLEEEDVGLLVSVIVTASNDSGEASATSSQTSAVLPLPPVSTAPPTISGVPKTGHTLTASTGSWTSSPPFASISYTYQWQRCSSASEEMCTNIAGATNATYVLSAEDAQDSMVRVLVTATNAPSVSASSASATNFIPRSIRVTEYTYDADGNLATQTDGDGHTTTYTYNADNDPIKITQPDGTSTETEYNPESQVIAQTDGDKHTTKYTRNILGQVTEVTDPLGRKTVKEYDKAGNLTSVTDAAGRTTTYAYDAANQLTGVNYSDGTTSPVKYEYDVDGNRTKMVDGTGTTTYHHDQLDRLTETTDGHGDSVGYEYNLANEQTTITYPGGKTVTQTYDNDGRLHSIEDWLANTTTFAYDPDSDLIATTFPDATGDTDTSDYNDAGEVEGIEMKKGAEQLASLAYSRDDDGQITSTASKGLPGEDSINDSYDEDNRLTKAGPTSDEYDAAGNPTKLGSSTNAYDEADELESSTGASYTYNEMGQRTKTMPTTGAATSYSYDQADDLTSVERPAAGETPAIDDSYGYNGDGLRTTETSSGATRYWTWDVANGLPLLLSDESNSYIYGPDGLPVEQIASGGTVTYLHHDQAGSTRLLTGTGGTITGKCAYGAYGAPTCEGTTTTPVGYDAQYTSPDTGLIYLRNRVYDPSTAQFLTVDPAVAVTRSPYNYAGDNPVNRRDPDGLSAEGIEGVPCYFPFCGPPPPAVEGVQHGIETVEHGIESVWNEVNEDEGPNDEGEAALKEKEAQRECGEPNPGSLEKLKKREIERILDEEGTDIHTDKEETVGKEAGGSYDYYRDKSTGEIYLIPKDGGEPIPTGLGG